MLQTTWVSSLLLPAGPTPAFTCTYPNRLRPTCMSHPATRDRFVGCSHVYLVKLGFRNLNFSLGIQVFVDLSMGVLSWEKPPTRGRFRVMPLLALHSIQSECANAESSLCCVLWTQKLPGLVKTFEMLSAERFLSIYVYSLPFPSTTYTRNET